MIKLQVNIGNHQNDTILPKCNHVKGFFLYQNNKHCAETFIVQRVNDASLQFVLYFSLREHCTLSTVLSPPLVCTSSSPFLLTFFLWRLILPVSLSLSYSTAMPSPAERVFKQLKRMNYAVVSMLTAGHWVALWSECRPHMNTRIVMLCVHCVCVCV